MSASREKKKRQELLAGGASDPKTARAAEQKAAERRSAMLYTAGAVAFIVIAVALFVYNSGIFQRNQTAVTIDGENYNVAKTSYYYQQICGNYASMFGQEYLQTLKAQSYDDNRTWDDFFKEEAVNNMKFVHAAAKAAKADGMTLDSDDNATIQANVDSIKSAASAAGYSYGSYLKAVYGQYMSGSVLKSCLEDQILASKYAAKHSEDNFVYTDDEIEAYYEEHKNSYDLVDGAYVTISGTPEAKTDADGNAVEATEEEKNVAMTNAHLTAESILAEVKNGADLETVAGRYDEASYTGGAEMTTSTGVAGEWLFDESRKAGDAEILADEDNSRYYVAVFNGRQRNEALDYNVRHILITAENLDLPDGETATEEQLTAKAQEILDGWDGTEDGFATLAEQYSQDGGSNTNGGLYEDVPKGYMVAAFQDWCYEDGRQSGDTGVVYNASTGAHIMYFVGYGDTQYWHYACENALRSADSTEWQNSLIDSTSAVVNDAGMKNVG